MDKFESIKISDIVVEERARKDLGNIEELANNIKKHGQLQPIVCEKRDGKLKLLAGGRRLEAAKQLGKESIIVMVMTKELSEEERLSIELSENFHRKDMTWDEQVKLQRKIHDLQQSIHGKPGLARVKDDGWTHKDTANLLGISVSSVQKDLAIAGAMQSDPEIFSGCKTKKEAAQRLRKVSGLVERNLLAEELKEKQSADMVKAKLLNSFVVGDFFKGVKDFPNNAVDLIECDPPYSINFDKKRESHKDNYTGYREVAGKDYPIFLLRTFEECYRVAKPNAWIVVWHSPSRWNYEIHNILEETGWRPIHSPGVWVKTGTGGYSGNPDIAFGSTVDFFTYARKGEAKLNRKGRTAHFTHGIVPFDQRFHPTERPVTLLQEILEAFAKPKSLVLCPFLGSGNTIIAASSQFMQCTGWELEATCKDGFALRLEERFKGLK